MMMSHHMRALKVLTDVKNADAFNWLAANRFTWAEPRIVITLDDASVIYDDYISLEVPLVMTDDINLLHYWHVLTLSLDTIHLRQMSIKPKQSRPKTLMTHLHEHLC